MKPIRLKTIFASISAIIFVVILPHTGIISMFSFAYTIPIIVFVWLYLKVNNETFATIGFSFKAISSKALFVGILVAPLSYLFMQGVFFPILERFIEFKSVDVALYNDLREGNKGYYIFIIVMSWIVGGVYEEIIFHAFIFTRLEKIISGRYKTIFSYLITSLIFGLYHYQLGAADTINAFFIGAIYLALFLYFKRNLWYSIFCHGVYNTTVITLLYLGYI